MAMFEISRDRFIGDFLGQKHSCTLMISISSIIHVYNGQNTTCDFFFFLPYGSRMVVSILVVNLVMALLTMSCSSLSCPASLERIVLYITSLGKDQISKF